MNSPRPKKTAHVKAPPPRVDRAPRVPFEHRVSVTIEHPGSSVVTFEVQARDLSRTGLRAQHANYVYPGSPAAVSFLRGRTVLFTVQGRVVRCEYVGGRAHDVGIAFESPMGSRELAMLDP